MWAPVMSRSRRAPAISAMRTMIFMARRAPSPSSPASRARSRSSRISAMSEPGPRVEAGPQGLQEPVQRPVDDPVHLLEGVEAAVVGVGDVAGALGIEVPQFHHAGGVAAEGQNVPPVGLVHYDDVVPAVELVASDLPGRTGQFDAPRPGDPAGALVGRLAHVPGPGPGRVHGEGVGEPGFCVLGAEHGLGQGRATDVAETYEQHMRGHDRFTPGDRVRGYAPGPCRPCRPLLLLPQPLMFTRKSPYGAEATRRD